MREIPLYTREGVKDAHITEHPFTTPDKLGLTLTRFHREDADDVVLIIHGLTTSSDMYIMPEHYNLVSYLLDHGWGDVWCLDFRMSNRFKYNLERHRYTHDDIALNDHPAAVELIRKLTGGARIHVICHCLGSVSFMMSLFGRATRGISSVIANSVALTPRVPAWSRIKLAMMPFLVDYVFQFDYINPNWSRTPGLTFGKVFSWLVTLFHRECKVPQCHMLSVMWGTGWPALYHHSNLHEVTHARGGDLYGPTSMHYYRHVRKMVRAGSKAVKYDPENMRLAALPNDYFEYAADIKTPVLFMTGKENNVFRDSNIVCHERLERIVPGRHELHVFDNYGHQDVFMGKTTHLDIFPRLAEFLEKHRGRDPGDDEVAPPPVDAAQPGISFAEKMKGPFALGITDPRNCPDLSPTLTIDVTVDIDNLKRFIADRDHTGGLSGRVHYAPLGENLEARRGVFNLFRPDEDMKLMVYELAFEADGQAYYLAGRKEVRDDPGLDLWSDTTTLFTTLHKGEDASGDVVGAGTLRLGVPELFSLIKSMEATNTDGSSDRLWTKARFGRFFLGRLWDSYGLG